MKALKLISPKYLPFGAWIALFKDRPVTFRGKKLEISLTDSGLRKIVHNDRIYLEQNPATQSSYAIKARAGRKILWVICLKTAKYLYRVENGKVHKL